MKRVALAGLLAIALLLVVGVAASAQQGPVESDTLYAGSYRLRVDLYSDPPFTGRTFQFDVIVSGESSVDLSDITLQAVALPDPGTNATALPARLVRSGSSRHGFKGEIRLPVRGGWQLLFTVQHRGGSDSKSLPLQVAAPPAIPISLAWAIALLPLFGLLIFLLEQRFYLERLQRTASPPPPSA
jgi:hypothetical protein